MTHANETAGHAPREVRAALRSTRKPRYQQIADTLREEIRRGEHAVGRFLGSEAELKARFKVSRHTVRDALRVLDELGLIARRRGAGSIVRNAEVHRHFDLALHSIADLLQYDESSDFHARYTDRLVANQELAGWLSTRLGTECILLHGVRIGRRTRRPIASVYVYRRASWRSASRPRSRSPRADRFASSTCPSRSARPRRRRRRMRRRRDRGRR
jgi:DNA-binding GntR family transcriptional regulator